MQHLLSDKSSRWGVILIALGAFFLLQVTGILGALSGLFWSIAFAAAGAAFVTVFLTGLHTRWWAAIPGFTLLGLAALIFYNRFAPPFFADIGAAVFLAAIGAGFLAIFFTNREQWWAIIPGGVLFSVAGVVVVSNTGFAFLNPASVLFIGIGLTFGLLGLMSTYLDANLRWAYFPAAIMLIMGIIIFTPFAGSLAWVWPLALIGAGAWLVLRRSQAGATPSSYMLPPAQPTAAASSEQPAITTPAAKEQPAEPVALR